MSKQTVLIKRVDDDGHDDHHGGGWKVAYADFMTAMMAFFLLLWILAASDEEKLRGLADYFTPSLSEAGGRGQGVLAGQVLAEDGILSGTDGPQSEVQLPSFGQENPLAVFDSRIRYDEKYASAASPSPGGANGEEGGLSSEGSEPGKTKPGLGDHEMNLGAAAQETSLHASEHEVVDSLAELIEAEELRERELAEIEAKVDAALTTAPDLAELRENLKFELTEEGLEIQIIDGEGRSMFEIGSAQIAGRTEALVTEVAEAIASTDWPLVISGHTDSLPYAPGANYTNWELSADRANATRRVLVDHGVDGARIVRVNAFADADPISPVRSDAPENRRIGILLVYPSALPGPMRGIAAGIGPEE